MALVFPGMPCAICKKAIAEDHSRFATWGVWLQPDDPLIGFCDAAVHWDCYADWNERPRVALAYFDFWKEHNEENPYWWQSYLDSTVLVTVNPSEPICQACVCLAKTGSRIMVPLDEWEKWLETGADDARHAVELEAIRSAQQVLSRERPTKSSLITSIRPDSKAHLFARLKNEERTRADAALLRQNEIAEHNRLCEEAMPHIRMFSHRCNGCNAESSDFRLSTREGAKSLIICRACGEVADPRTIRTAR